MGVITARAADDWLPLERHPQQHQPDRPSHSSRPLGAFSFSSLTIRLPRVPNILAILIQGSWVSVFLSCSCLFDTLATHKTRFPDF
jgi:hypothetical protein